MLKDTDLQEEIIKLTTDLVGIRSVNPPGLENKIADYAENYLEGIGIETESVPLNSDQDRRSVVGRISGKEEGSIVLCGHLDTVDVTDEDWSVPIFDPLVEDGKIYGRGSSDMKGGVAVILATAKAIMESGRSPEKDVVVALTADEESSYGGAYSLAETNMLDDASLLIITEPTDGEVYIGEKGELWIETTFSGEAAHGSTPEQGVNAVLMAAEFSTRVVKNVEDFPGDEYLGNTSINVGQLEGGWQVNIVPSEATVKLDIRVIEEEHKDLAVKTTKKLGKEIVKKYGGDFETTVTTYQKPIVSDFDDENVVRFLQSPNGKGQSPEELAAGIVPYCTDASALIPQLQTPLIICGPGEIEMAHQPDEYVTVDSLTDTLNTFLSFFDLK